MHIEIFGLDKYVVANLSRELQKPIIQLTKIDENNLFFSVHETLLFHAGVDQNAWHTFIKISMPDTLAPFQEGLRSIINKALKDQTIHIHYEFVLQNVNSVFTFIQKNYPLFVNESNQIKAQQIEEDETEDKVEIYHGNIFAGKETELDKLNQQVIASKTKKKKIA
ncbi:MAG: hypothetical protein RIS53_815 [Bacillota bacterium]|jgi:hypothetical protein